MKTVVFNYNKIKRFTNNFKLVIFQLNQMVIKNINSPLKIIKIDNELYKIYSQPKNFNKFKCTENNIEIKSSSYPEWREYTRTLYVCGSSQSGDDDSIKIKDNIILEVLKSIDNFNKFNNIKTIFVLNEDGSYEHETK